MSEVRTCLMTDLSEQFLMAHQHIIGCLSDLLVASTVLGVIPWYSPRVIDWSSLLSVRAWDRPTSAPVWNVCLK